MHSSLNASLHFATLADLRITIGGTGSFHKIDRSAIFVISHDDEAIPSNRAFASTPTVKNGDSAFLLFKRGRLFRGLKGRSGSAPTYLIKYSAIWIALRAAPFQSWSPTHQNASPLSNALSIRIRPTPQFTLPAKSSGIG